MVEVAAVFLLARQSEPQDVVGQNKTETQFVFYSQGYTHIRWHLRGITNPH